VFRVAVFVALALIAVGGCADGGDDPPSSTSAAAAATALGPVTSGDPSAEFAEAEWYEAVVTVTPAQGFSGPVCEQIDAGLFKSSTRAGIDPERGWAWVDTEATASAPERVTDGRRVWIARDVAWAPEEVDSPWVEIDADRHPPGQVAVFDFVFADVSPDLGLGPLLRATPAQLWEAVQADTLAVEPAGSEQFEGVPVERYDLQLRDDAVGIALVDDSGSVRVLEATDAEGTVTRTEIRPGSGPFDPVPPGDGPGLASVPPAEPALTVDCDIAPYLRERLALAGGEP